MTKHLTWLAATSILCQTHLSRADFLPLYGGPTQAAVPVRGTAVNSSGVAIGDYDVVEGGRFAGAVRWSGAANLATDLGTLAPALNPENFEGYSYGLYVRGINASGTAVGSAVDYYDSYDEETGESQRLAISRATRWDGSSATAIELANLGSAANGITQASANAINDAGIAVGYASRYNSGGTALGALAVRWDSLGTVTALSIPGLVSEDFGESTALAVNSAGTAVGIAFAGGTGLAARWDASSSVGMLLPQLSQVAPQDGERWESRADAINDAGTVVGISYRLVPQDDYFLLAGGAAMRWDASGMATQLEATQASIGDFTISQPFAINAAGESVGAVWEYEYETYESSISPTVISSRAVRWDASGIATLLQPPTNDADTVSSSLSTAINSAGTAVGFVSYEGIDGTRAVYWGGDAVGVDLNTLIEPNSGWLLTHAVDISDTGWIAGTGMYDPDGEGDQPAYSRHFLISVPATAVTGGFASGDFNGDTFVDGADLAQWQGDFGVNGDSDADGDDDSDGADFLAWQRQLGATPTIAAATTSVPEPATLLLVVPGAFAMMLRRRVAVSCVHDTYRNSTA